MAGATFKKRPRDATDAPRTKPVRPTKKQKKQAHAAYHSSSSENEDEEGGIGGGGDEFAAVNLLDSDDDDIHNAKVDDGADSQLEDGSDTGSEESGAKPSAPRKQKKTKAAPSIAKDAPQNKLAKDAPSSQSSDNSSDDGYSSSGDGDEYSDLDAGSDADGDGNPNKIRLSGSRSKRGDPAAFASSLSKILSTKLSTSRRADPVLARSAAAHEASRRAVDTALETKARKKLRDAKRAAMEKGRVRDVLVATNATFSNVHPVTGEVDPTAAAAGSAAVEEGETVGERLATERRLRKVAQRGVVQLFNAFRTAQVKAAEAERGAKDGVIGMDRKKEKVAEMSKKGFLDLIAAGGGGLKKGPMEEA